LIGGGGGSKFLNFFRLSVAAAGKFKNEEFFRK
jgi:hypothetical protein